LVQCILSGGDPTEKNEQGVSLLMQAQQAIPKV
jgi:L-lysine 2,3-aminomutase